MARIISREHLEGVELMSDYGECPRCGEWGNLTAHRKFSRPYEARLDETEWKPTCGSWCGLPSLDGTHGPRTAGVRAAKRIDAEARHVSERHKLWVRPEGDTGEGQAIRVIVEMVPEYSAEELSPCPGGCGRLVTLGIPCYNCRQAERAKPPAIHGGSGRLTEAEREEMADCEAESDWRMGA